MSLKHSEKRDRRGRGLDRSQDISPRPPGPPRSRGMAKMGGPGCVEMMLPLWYRVGAPYTFPIQNPGFCHLCFSPF